MKIPFKCRQSGWCASLIVIAGFSVPGTAHSGDESQQNAVVSEEFLVSDANGPSLLDSRGKEIRRLNSSNNGFSAFSPDGQWIAYADSPKGELKEDSNGNLIVESRVAPQHRLSVPLVWGITGSSLLLLWSSDSKRILICEQGWRNKVRKSAFRIYDLTSKDLTEFKLPENWWPSDWSADGKRVLTHDNGRIAWVNIDGTGEPEFITRELEVGYAARLSPDSSRILCLAGLRRPNQADRRLRLSVIDLKTRKRTIVDEPGDVQMFGYCWSADGSRIAYTWQKPFDRRADTALRETFLITCDRDGAQREFLTSRTTEATENGVVFFFTVHSWR